MSDLIERIEAAPLTPDADRWARIGNRAAELCYADKCPADNICVWSCSAVCPSDKYLFAASREIFSEYWENHPLTAALRAQNGDCHG